MKYYKLKYSYDPKVIGQVDNQIGNFGYNPPGLNYNYDPIGYGLLDINLPVLKMHSRAKLSDFVHSILLSNHYIICNDNVLTKVLNLNLPLHQILNFRFEFKKEIIENYKALYLVRTQEYRDQIVWEESHFYKTQKWHSEIVEEIKLNDFEDVLLNAKYNNSNGFGFLSKIKLKLKVNYDLFKIGEYYFPMGIFCSENFKSLVLENNFTGIEFEELGEEFFLE